MFSVFLLSSLSSLFSLPSLSPLSPFPLFPLLSPLSPLCLLSFLSMLSSLSFCILYFCIFVFLSRNHSNRMFEAECDVLEPGIRWYQGKVSEPVSEKIGSGKKYRNRYWKTLIPELISVAKIEEF